MGKDLEGIKIRYKGLGIRIEMEADMIMREIWKEAAKEENFSETEPEKIPKGLFESKFLNLQKYRYLYFSNDGQAALVLLSLVMKSQMFKQEKNAKIWEIFYHLADNWGSLYIKVLLVKDEEEKNYDLKTVFISSNEEMGLLSYL
jgi:hypothetical protein